MDLLRQHVVKLSEAVNAVEHAITSSSNEEKFAAFSVLSDEIEILRVEQAGVKFLSWKRADFFGELLQWIAGYSGAEVASVTVRETGDSGFGVFAKEAVYAENARPVIRIPQSVCLLSSYESPFFLGRCLSLMSLPDNIKLVNILMSEVSNTGESLWKPYIRSLPTSLNTIMHLDGKSIRSLDGSIYLDDVLRRYCNICKHYINSVIAVDMKLNSKSDKKKFSHLFSFDLFRWAVDVVMTRANAVPVPGSPQPVLALIPLLDMVNHGKAEEKFYCVAEADQFFAELRLSHPLKAGDEITMSYQTLSVKNRLLNHGFITPDEGVLEFFVEAPPAPLEIQEAVQDGMNSSGVVLFQRNENGNLEFQAEFQPSGEASDITLAVIRSFVGLRGKFDVASVMTPLEPDLEKLVFMAITKRATELLKKLPVDSNQNENNSETNGYGRSVVNLCQEETALEKQRLQTVISYNSEKLKSILTLLVSNAKTGQVDSA